MELTYTLNANYTPTRARKATLNGREYYVAPMTLIVPGVLDGSKGPLYYPPEEIRKSVSQWNNKPLTLNHPYINGIPTSASKPEAMNLFGIGVVLNARISKKGNLVAEGWFDIELVKRLDTSGKVLKSLENGLPLEQSTGLFNDRIQVQNSHYNGKHYAHVAKNYVADHVAVLPHQKGACSLNDGCGVLIDNAAAQPTVETLTEQELNMNGWSEAARVAAILARRRGIKGAGKLAKRFVRSKINAKIGQVKQKARNEVERVKDTLAKKVGLKGKVTPPPLPQKKKKATPPPLPDSFRFKKTNERQDAKERAAGSKKTPPPLPSRKGPNTYGVEKALDKGKRSAMPEVQRVKKVQARKKAEKANKPDRLAELDKQLAESKARTAKHIADTAKHKAETARIKAGNKELRKQLKKTRRQRQHPEVTRLKRAIGTQKRLKKHYSKKIRRLSGALKED